MTGYDLGAVDGIAVLARFAFGAFHVVAAWAVVERPRSRAGHNVADNNCGALLNEELVQIRTSWIPHQPFKQGERLSTKRQPADGSGKRNLTGGEVSRNGGYHSFGKYRRSSIKSGWRAPLIERGVAIGGRVRSTDPALACTARIQPRIVTNGRSRTSGISIGTPNS